MNQGFLLTFLRAAIGVRGPVHVIFQNAGLVILVLDLALLIGVFVPYYVGKHLALLSVCI